MCVVQLLIDVFPLKGSGNFLLWGFGLGCLSGAARSAARSSSGIALLPMK